MAGLVASRGHFAAMAKMLLFDEQGEQTGPNYTVAMRDMTGSPPVALGEGMAGDFSPDGKWVAATVSYTQLVLLPTGAGTVRRIDRDDIQQYGHEIHWLPDGKQILFTGNLAGTRGPVFCSEHRSAASRAPSRRKESAIARFRRMESSLQPAARK